MMSREVPADLVVLMLDGVAVAEHTCVVALGIDADGVKHPLGISEGATENKAVCARALADLAERGLSADDGLLVVIDGSKTLRAAVADALGEKAAGNVKRWRGGEMVLRWTAAGILDTEHSFRRVRGHRELPKLRAALRRHANRIDGEEVRDSAIAA
jgi:hypothetical protein